MSAFIVNTDHINLLLSAGLSRRAGVSPLRWMAPISEEPEGDEDYQRGEVWGPSAMATAQRRSRSLTEETVESVGLLLLAQNVASVNHRYAETSWPTLSTFVRVTDRRDGPPSPIQVLKALDCYEYQACEDPQYDQTEAAAFCQALRKRMIQSLPGYEEAKWEWSR